MVKMDYEAEIEKCIKGLSFEECEDVGFFCIDRVLDLYRDVDTRLDISEASENMENGTAFITLETIYKKLKLKTKQSSLDISKLREKINFLILDTDDIYDSTTENILAKIVAENLYTLTSFMVTKNKEYIFDCVRLNLEIINAQLSDYFYQEVDEDESKCDVFLDSMFILEYKIQLEAIQLIKDKRFSSLDELINRTSIDKNPKKTIENLKFIEY